MQKIEYLNGFYKLLASFMQISLFNGNNYEFYVKSLKICLQTIQICGIIIHIF